MFKQSTLCLAACLMLIMGINQSMAAPSVYTAEAQKDRIHRLPKASGPVTFPYFGGYISLPDGKNMYYNFAASKRGVAANDPIVFYFSGGPGCSSVGLGEFSMTGPFVLYANGTILANRFSFNSVANMVYVDSPVGAGFSYATDQSAVVYNDDATAVDNMNFIKAWFERYPQFKGRNMYLAGESFGRHFLPTLATLLVNNTDAAWSNFKGIVLGNPFTQFSTDFIYSIEYMYGHAMITKEARNAALLACGNITDVGVLSLDVPASAVEVDGRRRLLQNECSAAQKVLSAQIGDVDMFDIFFDPLCQEETPRTTRCKDIVYLRAQTYFSRSDVQKAIHANTTGQVPGPWQMCNRTILPLWSQSDFAVRSHATDYPYLLSRGLRVLIYSGDTDLKVPFEGTRAWITSLKLTPKTDWHAWHGGIDGGLGGWGQSYQEGLTFVTVRNAGHFAAMNQRDRVLALFTKFLNNDDIN